MYIAGVSSRKHSSSEDCRFNTPTCSPPTAALHSVATQQLWLNSSHTPTTITLLACC
jgi:hypothetical protein